MKKVILCLYKNDEWGYLQEKKKDSNHIFYLPLPSKRTKRRELLDSFIKKLKWKKDNSDTWFPTPDIQLGAYLSRKQWEVLKMILLLKRPWFYLDSYKLNRLKKMDWEQAHTELSPRWLAQLWEKKK